ncbi:MAG: fimbria major subunit [Paramuribaculum sp.]|nr:fimbria major subunit [Paramuribaculum sp.]
MLCNTANTPTNLKDAIDENYYVDADGNKVDKNTPGAKLDHPILYMFDNVLYVKFTAVIAAANATAPGDVLNNAVLRPNTDKGYAHSVAKYYTAWQTAGGGQEVGENGYAQFLEFKKAAVDAGITIYQWATDEYLGAGQTTPYKGYFCYYYYWNRHNDNNIPGVMGPMEFAVVRNNVYKISVDKIRRIGHPRRTENDPDPQTPDTPDEESDVYLDVQVKTLPWVVRYNSVEF